MTHFIGAVIVPAHVPVELTSNTYERYGYAHTDVDTNPELELFLTTALARFDENREVRIWDPKSKLIEESRAEVAEYEGGTYWQEWLKDPAAYKAENGRRNPHHINYLEKDFPKMLLWTDEEHYQNQLKYSEDGDIRADGARLNTYNPDSKWDWYVVGGRWADVYAELQGKTIRDLRALLNIQDPDEYAFPLSLVVKTADEAIDEETNVYLQGYEWITPATVGWFGYVSEFNRADWKARVDDILAEQDPDATVVFIDFHI